MDNLILLCHTCHDRIECDIDRFPTKASILRMFAQRDEPEPVEVRPDVGVRWQEWVYGGKQKPETKWA